MISKQFGRGFMAKVEEGDILFYIVVGVILVE